MALPTPHSARAKLAVMYTYGRTPTEDALAEARRELAAANINAAIRKQMQGLPLLTPDQTADIMRTLLAVSAHE